MQQAQTEKEQVRQRLLGQLNQVLQTKDSARGLIVNMPDVLFNLNSASLKPDARERLAKVAGILIAYPDIRVEVNGYTDNTGSSDYNQRLSEQRAETVRDYLVRQGVPSGSITSRGLGPNDPIASNDSPEGRRQNRRVNLVVSGQSIGAQMMTPEGPAR
jgi:outer membrane protein OmpA-like peptidoglycan-associated protein